MKGDLIRYTQSWTGIEFLGIIIDILDGFHARKSWSQDRTFIEQTIFRIFWLNEPGEKPPTAQTQIAKNWRESDPIKLNFIDNANVVIDEFPMLSEESDWYFPDHFDLVEIERV